MMGLMATYADAWNSDRRNDVDELLAIEAQVDAACIKAGRDPATLERVVGIQVDLLDEQREAHTPRQYVKRFWPHGGSAEQIAEAIRDYTRATVDHLIVWIDPVSVEGVEAFAPVLEILDRGK
jgi:hypothetical protein